MVEAMDDLDTDAMRAALLVHLLTRLKPVTVSEAGERLFAVEDVAGLLGLPVEVCEQAIQNGRRAQTLH